jgi:hypothetical protein
MILRTVVWATDIKRPAQPALDSAGHPIESRPAEPAPARS